MRKQFVNVIGCLSTLAVLWVLPNSDWVERVAADFDRNLLLVLQAGKRIGPSQHRHRSASAPPRHLGGYMRPRWQLAS